MGAKRSGYLVELLAPRQKAGKLRERLDKFAGQYHRAVGLGHRVCVPDNPMGRLAFQGHELLEELRLPADGGQVSVHLNTFHGLPELLGLLDRCAALGVKEILVVSGDGSARLPRLKPSELGYGGGVVTSVELLDYVGRRYPGCFELGCAFNQYEPEEDEFEKLRRKIDAGASFVITQPVVGANRVIDRLLSSSPVPVTLEAWMSPKIQLLADCVGYDLGVEGEFDPLATLRALGLRYPGRDFYLALLDFERQLPELDVEVA